MSGTLPLFEKYPALSGLPYVRLGLFPTPVQELHGLSESDNRVFIKRDDLSGLEYGGNKVRKLEFALGEAKANGCTDVITFGCDGSNMVSPPAFTPASSWHAQHFHPAHTAQHPLSAQESAQERLLRH